MEVLNFHFPPFELEDVLLKDLEMYILGDAHGFVISHP
jgi:hypothetical protein